MNNSLTRFFVIYPKHKSATQPKLNYLLAFNDAQSLKAQRQTKQILQLVTPWDIEACYLKDETDAELKIIQLDLNQKLTALKDYPLLHPTSHDEVDGNLYHSIKATGKLTSVIKKHPFAELTVAIDQKAQEAETFLENTSNTLLSAVH